MLSILENLTSVRKKSMIYSANFLDTMVPMFPKG